MLLLYVLLVFTFVLRSFAGLKGAGELTCYYKYLLFGDACYRYYSSPLANYDKALKICRSEGADLISIHNAFENAYSAVFNQKGILIGLRYDPVNSSYKWSDGSSLDYANYASTFEINHDFLGDCAKNVNGKWQNAECDVDYLEFLCKKNATEFFPSSNSVCPDPTAIYFAPDMVVSPGYPTEYDFNSATAAAGCIYKLAAKNYHRLKIKFEEMALKENSSGLYIYKGWEATKTNEVARADNKYEGSEIIVNSNLAILHLSDSAAGLWKITTSSLERNDSSITPPKDVCPDFNLLYTDSKEIYSPGFPELYDFPMEVMAEGCYYKIAAKTGQYIRLNLEEIFMEDDTGFIDVFKAWEPVEENKVITLKNRHMGSTFTVDADEVLLHFWNSPHGRFKISWSGILTDKCAASWRYFNGSCYYSDHTHLTHSASIAFCAARDSHLVYIQSQEEAQFVTFYNGEIYFGKQTWIGLIYNHGWQWLDGSKLDYSNWYPGEPDYGPGSAPYCGFMYYTCIDKWADYGCNNANSGSLCEHETREIAA